MRKGGITNTSFFKNSKPQDAYIMAGQNCIVRFDSELTPALGINGVGTDELNTCLAVVISRTNRTRISLLHLDQSSLIESLVEEIKWISENYPDNYTINVFGFIPSTSEIMRELEAAEKKGGVPIRRNDIKQDLKRLISELESKYQLKKPSVYKDDFPPKYQSLFIKPDTVNMKLIVSDTLDSASMAIHEDKLKKEARFGVNEFNGMFNGGRHSVQLQFDATDVLPIAPLVGVAKEFMDFVRSKTATLDLQEESILPCEANKEVFYKLKQLFIDFVGATQCNQLPENYLLIRAVFMRMILLDERATFRQETETSKAFQL